MKVRFSQVLAHKSVKSRAAKASLLGGLCIAISKREIALGMVNFLDLNLDRILVPRLTADGGITELC